ncbi:MAG: hypothetical protein JSW40_05590 [Candidatus Omnitrophota bacterium]|nr:MAG: hypothetical protein JSW40_05590 [Candidatus Omnitrophota bacterium]
MKVPTDKKKVNIFCSDNSFVTGIIHVPQGLRLLDHFNNANENFLVVTEAFFQNLREVHSFKLVKELKKQRSTVILYKSCIKWIEELKK